MFKYTVHVPEEEINNRHIVLESQDGGYPDAILMDCQNGETVRYVRKGKAGTLEIHVTAEKMRQAVLWILAGMLTSVTIQTCVAIIQMCVAATPA